MSVRNLFLCGLTMTVLAVLAMANNSLALTGGMQAVSSAEAQAVSGGARCPKSTKLTEKHCTKPGCTPMVYWMLNENGDVDDVKGLFQECVDGGGASCGNFTGDGCEVPVPCDHP